MAVYHFTFHAYRSWRPDHPRGFVQYHKGIQEPSERLADAYDERAQFDRFFFDTEIQRLLIAGAHEICSRRGWCLHGSGTDPSHVHFLVSWRGYLPWEVVHDRLKNVLSLFIGRFYDKPGRTWFVRKGSRRRVTRQGHFDYLLDAYFPDHRGVFWREGMELPKLPDRVLKPRSDARSSDRGYQERTRKKGLPPPDNPS